MALLYTPIQHRPRPINPPHRLVIAAGGKGLGEPVKLLVTPGWQVWAALRARQPSRKSNYGWGTNRGFVSVRWRKEPAPQRFQASLAPGGLIHGTESSSAGGSRVTKPLMYPSASSITCRRACFDLSIMNVSILRQRPTWREFSLHIPPYCLPSGWPLPPHHQMPH